MSDQAIITVTFYIGASDKPDDKLSKRYVLKKWGHEWALRALLDEVIKELNYISGYGVWSVRVKSEQLEFTVDYKDQFKPCLLDKYLYFQNVLRLNVGQYTGWRRGGAVKIEIPRVHLNEANNLFPIKRTWVGSKKKIRRYGTMYHLQYDRSNPTLVSFLKRIKDDIFVPNVQKKWHRTEGYNITWWELTKTQTSQYRWAKEEKRQQKEKRKQKKLEKAGIVYKDKKKKKKAHQVYIIQAKDESLPNVYKIGISNAPGKRLQALSTSNPFDLEIVHKFVAEPAEEAEGKLHEKFADNRLSGEWFKLGDEQVAELRRIRGYANGEFLKDQELPFDLLLKEANQIDTKTIEYKGVEIVAIQNFGLGFSLSQLNLNDLLWLYEHYQSNKDVYTATVTGNLSGPITDFKEVKKFSASVQFAEWNTETTKCVDELLKRFELNEEKK